MKAIAVFPGKPNTVHLAKMPKPALGDVPKGHGVLVKVLRVGVDGTDKEINAAEYGTAPEGHDFLVIGLIEALGGRHEATEEVSVEDVVKRDGPFDLIFEATGFSPIVFDSMLALAKNGVLVLSSVTGGDRKIEVRADRINLEFALGNKVMVGTVNASHENFEAGVRDMAQAEAQYPGWLGRLLTHPVKGLENYQTLFQHLTNGAGAIKVFCEAADLAVAVGQLH